MNEPINDNPAPPQPKPAVTLLVCKSGQFITRPAISGQPAPLNLTMPLNLQGDPRLFVKNGEIVQSYVAVEFKHRKSLDVSGIDLHIYYEVAVKQIDPTDMQPITMRSLDKIFEDLNAPKTAEAPNG